MDELDVTSEEEEEEEGEAEGETEGDEMEDEMTDVWWKTRPYSYSAVPATLSNREAQKSKDQSAPWYTFHQDSPNRGTASY